MKLKLSKNKKRLLIYGLVSFLTLSGLANAGFNSLAAPGSAQQLPTDGSSNTAAAYEAALASIQEFMNGGASDDYRATSYQQDLTPAPVAPVTPVAPATTTPPTATPVGEKKDEKEQPKKDVDEAKAKKDAPSAAKDETLRTNLNELFLSIELDAKKNAKVEKFIDYVTSTDNSKLNWRQSLDNLIRKNETLSWKKRFSASFEKALDTVLSFKASAAPTDNAKENKAVFDNSALVAAYKSLSSKQQQKARSFVENYISRFLSQQNVASAHKLSGMLGSNGDTAITEESIRQRAQELIDVVTKLIRESELNGPLVDFFFMNSIYSNSSDISRKYIAAYNDMQNYGSMRALKDANVVLFGLYKISSDDNFRGRDDVDSDQRFKFLEDLMPRTKVFNIDGVNIADKRVSFLNAVTKSLSRLVVPFSSETITNLDLNLGTRRILEQLISAKNSKDYKVIDFIREYSVLESILIRTLSQAYETNSIGTNSALQLNSIYQGALNSIADIKKLRRDQSTVNTADRYVATADGYLTGGLSQYDMYCLLTGTTAFESTSNSMSEKNDSSRNEQGDYYLPAYGRKRLLSGKARGRLVGSYAGMWPGIEKTCKNFIASLNDPTNFADAASFPNAVGVIFSANNPSLTNLGNRELKVLADGLGKYGENKGTLNDYVSAFSSLFGRNTVNGKLPSYLSELYIGNTTNVLDSEEIADYTQNSASGFFMGDNMGGIYHIYGCYPGTGKDYVDYYSKIPNPTVPQINVKIGGLWTSYGISNLNDIATLTPAMLTPTFNTVTNTFNRLDIRGAIFQASKYAPKNNTIYTVPNEDVSRRWFNLFETNKFFGLLDRLRTTDYDKLQRFGTSMNGSGRFVFNNLGNTYLSDRQLEEIPQQYRRVRKNEHEIGTMSNLQNKFSNLGLRGSNYYLNTNQKDGGYYSIFSQNFLNDGLHYFATLMDLFSKDIGLCVDSYNNIIAKVFKKSGADYQTSDISVINDLITRLFGYSVQDLDENFETLFEDYLD